MMSYKKNLLIIFIFLFVSLPAILFFKFKNNLRDFVRIIKQELTEPNIKYKNRMPSLKHNIYTYIKYVFSSDNQSLVKNNIKNLKVLSNNNSEFYTLYDEIFMNKLYYFETEKENPFIVDCGSNIGMSIIFFKDLYPNSEIIGFEPSSHNFKILNKNIKNNNLKNVELINKALSDNISSTKLYGAGTPMGSIDKDNPHNPGNYEIVKTTLLSEYISKPVDFLKLDVEGFEYVILKELDDQNKLDFVEKIIMEYHHFTNQNRLSKLLEILERNNFKYQICADQHPPIEHRLAQHFFIYAYKA
ncbi:FkbM family methyltransferase [Candidatus Dependentiae bacterium]|nr:FkbM family methyltransferase [Candidatus Dependentiae bacterium]